MDVYQHSLLDRLTTIALESLQLKVRLDLVLRFFVPLICDAAYVTLQNELGESRVAAGFPSAAVSQEGGALALPLQVRGTTLGALHIYTGTPREFATPEFLEACASRLAPLLYNSRLFEHEQRVAVTFQNVAISANLPDIPGYRFSAVYEAGRAEALVGGDWYDAFRIADGRVVLSIGDVQGSGLEAAVAMMNVRQTLRGVAHIHPDPVQMLAAADRALQEQHADRFVTTFVAVVDPITQICTYANAGHPAPLLRLTDGRVQALSGGGVPLGVPGFADLLQVEHRHLPPQSLLVLYTDGIIESARDVLEGQARLESAVRSLEPSGDETAKRLYEIVLPSHSRDDVAILTVDVAHSAPVRRWRYDPLWRDVATRVRAELCEALVEGGLQATELFNVETIFAELMANAIRYAPGTIEVLLEGSPRSFVLHVLDKGPGFQFLPRLPNDLFSQSGRGLFLISQLSADFNVEHRPGGGSHARVVLNE